MSVDIEAVKAMLAGITQGEWYLNLFNIYANFDTDHQELVVALEEFSPADGAFIAAAPSLVREMADEIVALRAKVAELQQHVKEMNDDLIDTSYPRNYYLSGQYREELEAAANEVEDAEPSGASLDDAGGSEG